MRKGIELLLAGIAVFLIIFSAVFILSASPQEYAFEFETENILFASNYAHPGEHLKSFGGGTSFIIASEFLERGSTDFMTQPITLFNSVLVAQDKFVITVAKTFDEEKNLLECHTNDGDKLTSRKISPKECNALFENTPHVVFLVKLPDSTLLKSKVTVFESSVIIEPNSFEEVSRISFLVLKTMFSESEEIVDLINKMLEVVKV